MLTVFSASFLSAPENSSQDQSGPMFRWQKDKFLGDTTVHVHGRARFEHVVGGNRCAKTTRQGQVIVRRGTTLSRQDASEKRLFPRHASDVVREDMVSDIHPKGNGSAMHASRAINRLGN
jgi:hypothetical protein